MTFAKFTSALHLALSILCLQAMGSPAPPEKIDIHGSVYNDSDQPLAGVTVAIKGTRFATKTNEKGVFELQGIDAGATLIFTYVGFEEKSVPVGNQSNLIVKLTPSSAKLDQVIIVGYGSQRRSAITGSIATVSSKDFKDAPVANIGQSLQGKLAGVQIAQTTGTPGGALKVQIRGAVSLTAGADPLYVVDGAPIVGDLSFINPDEVESITVLKDPAVASLYGSRAANGVVLVQTKTASSGKPQISVNSYYGVESIPSDRKLKFMNAEEYAQFQNDVAVTNGRPVNPVFQNPSQYKGKGTNWYDVITRKGTIQNYGATISAGTDVFKIATTLGYFNQEGVVVGSGFQRFSLRMNARYQPTDKLTIGVNIAPTYVYNTNLPTDGNPYGSYNMVSAALITTPLASPYNPDGTLALTAQDPATFGNPNWLRVAKQKVYKNKDQRLLTNVYLEYRPVNGLTAKSTINVQTDNQDVFQFNPSTIGTLFVPPPTIPSGSDYANRFTSIVNENTLAYQRSFGKHNFDVLAGFTNQSYRYDAENIDASNYPDDKIQAVSAAGTISVTTDVQEWTLLSYLARLNYNFDGKYLFTASIRRDGSSRFGPDQRYGNFPAVSAGWIISKEKFWKLTPVNFFKIRASYGVNGNFNIGNYSAIASVGSTYYPFGNSYPAGRALNNLTDSKLGWESNKQLDLGLEAHFLDGRIQLSYAHYIKNVEDLLYNVQVPVSSGFSALQTNVGKLRFTGDEISLNATVIRSAKLTWNASFNIAFARNKTIALSTQGGRLNTGHNYYNFYSNATVVGHPIAQFYGAIHEGVYKDQADFDKSPKFASSAVGTAKFKDINGDGVITFPEDMTLIGTPWPKYTFGMTHNVSYGNFDLSLTIAGSYGNQIFAGYQNWAANLDGVFNVLESVSRRWKSPTDPGDGKWGSVQAGTTNIERDRPSTLYLYDGSYLSFKNVQLGYRIPKIKATRVFQSARIFFSAQNLFIITHYPGGNPEVNTATSASGSSPGMDENGYPVPRTMTLGANFSF